MSRFGLAFRCFFRLLFRGSLPPAAVDYLPDEVKPRALPEAKAKKEPGEEPAEKAEKRPEKAERPRPAARPAETAELHREGALAVLGLLQREGRLVDFLLESIEDYDDSDVGVAARDIHRGCRKVLVDHLELEPVMPGDEDDEVTIPKGFDPGEVRLVGEAKGDPPFKGVLRHHGWRVTGVTLPTLTDGVDRRVLAPAEVEVP
jgi:hypothetical protein